MTNYYEILELEDFSDIEAIKAAHRRLSKVYHPDLNNGSKYHEEKFKEIQHAYEQLRDPVTKAAYDGRLRDQYIYEASEDHMYHTTGAEYTERPFVYEPPPHESSRDTWRPVSYIATFLIVVAFNIWKSWNENSPSYFVPVKQVDYQYPPIDTSIHYIPPAYESIPRYMGPSYQKQDPVYFKIGATREEVYKIQGTPTGILNYKDDETWSYGNSVVNFKEGMVVSYKNIDGNLHVRP